MYIPTLPFTNLIFIRICKYFWLQKTQTWVSSSIENIPPKRISQKQKHLGKDVVGTIQESTKETVSRVFLYLCFFVKDTQLDHISKAEMFFWKIVSNKQMRWIDKNQNYNYLCTGKYYGHVYNFFRWANPLGGGLGLGTPDICG